MPKVAEIEPKDDEITKFHTDYLKESLRMQKQKNGKLVIIFRLFWKDI